MAKLRKKNTKTGVSTKSVEKKVILKTEKKPLQAVSKKERDLLLVKIILTSKSDVEREDAYRKLWNRYRQQLKIFIWKYVKTEEDSEDVLQDSFIKAFNSIKSYDKKYAFSTWLYRIASNTAIDFLRRNKIEGVSINQNLGIDDQDAYFLEIPDRAFGSMFELEVKKERRKILNYAIEKLPGSYKNIIKLRHSEDLSYEEISKLLGMPIGTVKVYIFRAREMLYKLLKNDIKNY